MIAADQPQALIVNAGSTSLRLALWSLADTVRSLASASYSPAPTPGPDLLHAFLNKHQVPEPAIVMHRVVHGGTTLTEPCVVTAPVTQEIDRLRALAPLHNAQALQWIDAARDAFGESVVHGAAFDTAFYRDLPPHAARYALPQDVAEAHGLRRYGFHGLAHQSLVERWRASSPAHSDGKVISLQLGGGCSMTATDHGRPVETSMGFSPLEGLMMGTRAGNIDAAAVLHLIEVGGLSPSQVGGLLNRSAGLRGVSGESADMRMLLASGSEAAELAITMFCHRIRHYVGAYLAILGGADAIVFGGGIGEHAAPIRARALDRLGWAGIHLDVGRNAAVCAREGGAIHADDSRVEIWVTPTDEARVLAGAAHDLLTHLASASTPEDNP